MAKENNTLLALVAVLLFSAIGIIIKQFIEGTLTGMNETGIVGDILKFIKTPGLFAGLLWLLVCVVCYFGTAAAFSEGTQVGPISVLFLLLWLFTNLGLIVGWIGWLIIDGQSISLDLDFFVNNMTLNLSFSLAPSFAAALGISNKN